MLAEAGPSELYVSGASSAHGISIAKAKTSVNARRGPLRGDALV